MSEKIASGIFIFNKKGQFLVEHPTYHSRDFWSIPKGIVEPGEDHFRAAIREVYEETYLDLDNIEYKLIGEVPLIKYKKGNKSLKAFVILVEEDLDDFPFKCISIVDKPDRRPFPEVDGWKWVTPEEGYTLLHESGVRALEIIKSKYLFSIL